VFNLADCFLVGGACLLVLHGIFVADPKKTATTSSTPTLSPT
jgi:lipoprotein signal peptidase